MQGEKNFEITPDHKLTSSLKVDDKDNTSAVHKDHAEDGEVKTAILDEEAHIDGENDAAEKEAADNAAAKDTDSKPKDPSRVVLLEEEEEEGDVPLTIPVDSNPKEPSRVLLAEEEEEEGEEPVTNAASSKPKEPSRVILAAEEGDEEAAAVAPVDGPIVLADEDEEAQAPEADKDGKNEEGAVAALTPSQDGPIVLVDDDEEAQAPAVNDGKDKEPSRVILPDEEEEEEVEERHEEVDEVDDDPLLMGFGGPNLDAQRLPGQQQFDINLLLAQAEVAALAHNPAFNQFQFPGVHARPPAQPEALEHGGEDQLNHAPLTRADRLRQALQLEAGPPQRQSFVRSPKKLLAAKKAPSTKQYNDVIQENSLQWKLMEACVALCDKSVRSEIEKHNPKPSETDPNKKNELKLNYARHFNFIVEKNPKRAQELLKRLIQIRREKPKPNFSTADYIFIIAGDPNGFMYQNNLSTLKSNVTKIDGGETDSVIKLQVQTSDNRTIILYAQKESYQEDQTHCQFNAIIPLSYYLTGKDILIKTSLDQSGRTSLHWAAISGSFAMMQTLEKGYEHLRKHSKIPANSLPQYSSVDARNNTVAHEIARSGLYQIAVDNNTTHNITVEQQQFEFQHEASVKITTLRDEDLISLIKNPHISFFCTRNIQGDLPIHLVVSNNQKDLLETLLHDPNAPFSNLDADLYGTNGSATNVSLLHYAAMCPEVHWKTVQLIIEEKPKLLNAQDSKGFKPLDYAAGACNVPTQLLLLAKGAALATKSYTGDSPLSIALTTYTFDDEEIGTSTTLPLHMSTRIPGFNTITQRRFLQVPTHPTDEHSRYITSEELKSLDEILNDKEIMRAFTQLHDRLKLASWSALEKKLKQKNGESNSATPLSYPDKLATRLREYALLPIAVLQFKGVEFGAREKAASSENTRGLQVIRTAQFYSSFFTRKEFPISVSQRKNFLIDIGRGNSNTALEDLILPLSEIIEGFKVLLRQTICLYDDLWVMEDTEENGIASKKYSLDEDGQRIPSWGQWWAGETPYKQITINILDKVEKLLSKVEQVNSQLAGESIEIDSANEQLSGYKKELIGLIDAALRKADKKMLHVDHDTSDPATSDFRIRCMVAKVLAEKAVLTKADTPDTKPVF